MVFVGYGSKRKGKKKDTKITCSRSHRLNRDLFIILKEWSWNPGNVIIIISGH